MSNRDNDGAKQPVRTTQVIGWWSTIGVEYKLSALMFAWPIVLGSTILGHAQSGMLLALAITLAVGTLEVLTNGGEK